MSRMPNESHDDYIARLLAAAQLTLDEDRRRWEGLYPGVPFPEPLPVWGEPPPSDPPSLEMRAETERRPQGFFRRLLGRGDDTPTIR